MKKGFTLVEGMVVAAIIGMFVAIMVPAFMKAKAMSVYSRDKLNNPEQFTKEGERLDSGLMRDAGSGHFVDTNSGEIVTISVENPLASIEKRVASKNQTIGFINGIGDLTKRDIHQMLLNFQVEGFKRFPQATMSSRMSSRISSRTSSMKPTTSQIVSTKTQPINVQIVKEGHLYRHDPNCQCLQKKTLVEKIEEEGRRKGLR
ncbi:unnamed protein product [marine sediment metagenome]|uniref:Prepilin-type N-terminal cleavage/methylation domain-containing protein n=1 Tax=marine sediment metagenome TaxID=412755 RepID=X1BZJ9_9ZZZZ